jgi:uncharacterized protein (DUF1330 family)
MVWAVKYYAIAKIDVTDPSWVRDYITNVTPIVERGGGRYLARTSKVEHVEGGEEGERGSVRIERTSAGKAANRSHTTRRAPQQYFRIGNVFLLSCVSSPGAEELPVPAP